MQTRITKLEPIGVSAADAARFVGLRSAEEFRKAYGGLVKPLPISTREVYSIEAVRRAFTSLSASSDGAPSLHDRLEEQMLRRLS